MISNKKGQLGKIITSFPIMLAIFFLFVIYFAIVGLNVVNRPKPFSQAQGQIASDSVLLKKINVQGEEMTVLDGFVKVEQMSKETIAAGNPNDKIEEMNRYYSDFIAEIFNQLRIESKFTGKKCMILDYPYFTPPADVPDVDTLVDWRYYKFEEGKVSVLPITHDSVPFKDEVIAVKFSLKKSDSGARDISLIFSPNDMSTEQGKIVYYYGDCFKGINFMEISS